MARENPICIDSEPRPDPRYHDPAFWKVCVAVFFATFWVYLSTLCPAVYWDDGGELALSCAVLGVSHPPGQPLYALIGRLFCLCPAGSTGGFRVNIMSAFFGSLSAALACWSLSLLPLARGTRRTAGALAGLFWAFGFTFWNQSLVAENTTLNAFFVASIWILLWKAKDAGMETQKGHRIACLTMAMIGLGLANHPGLVFMAPAFACLLTWRGILGCLRPSRMARLLAFGFLGWASYAVFLPLVAERNPYINLGDPSSWKGWWWVFSVQQYQQTAPTGALEDNPLLKLALSLRALALDELPPGTWILILLAFFRLGRKMPRMFVAAAAAAPLFLYLGLNPNFIRAYQVPFHMILCGLAGLGGACLFEVARSVHPVARFSVLLTLASLVCIQPFKFQVEMDRSTDWSAEIYGMEILRSSERPCVILTASGHAFHILMHEICLRGLTDSKAVVSRNHLLRSSLSEWPQLGLERHLAAYAPWVHIELGQGVLMRFIELNPALHLRWEGLDFDELTDRGTYQLLCPDGPIFSVCRSDAQFRQCRKRDPEYWKGWWPRVFRDPGFQGTDANGRSLYCITKIARGNYEFNLGRTGLLKAVREYEDAVRIDPKSAWAWGNLGGSLAELGQTQRAELALRMSLRLSPGQFPAALSLAELLLRTSRQDEARQVLLQARPFCPPDKPPKWMDLGFLLLRAGAREEGVKCLLRFYDQADPTLRQILLQHPQCPEELRARQKESHPGE